MGTPAPSAESLIARAVLQNGLLPVCVARRGRISDANAQSEALFCKSPLQGTALVDLADGAARERLLEALAATRDQCVPAEFHFQARRGDGTAFEAAVHAVRVGERDEETLVLTFEDVSERRRSLMRLHSLAFTDALTGLSNRALFQDRVRTTLLQARRQGEGFAILVADLDGFKEVNDRLGHDAGDVVLKQAAERLRDTLRAGDTLARVGGDEFALLLPRLGRPEDAALVAGRAVRTVSRPFLVAGRPVEIGLSVGIAVWPDHGDDLDSLRLQADAAMYDSKRSGKNRYCFARAGGAGSGFGYVPFFEWSEAYRLGVAILDEHHLRLAQLINALGKALKSGEDRDRLAGLFGELSAFAKTHFAAEERLMDEHGYGLAARHKAHHRRLLEDLLSLSANLDGQSMVLTMRHLEDWLLRHVDTSDRLLAQELLKRGVR